MKKAVILSLLVAAGVMVSPNLASARCTDGKDRRVKIINDTRTTLRELYGSNVNSNSWEEDVLGEGVIEPGGTRVVNFDDGTCYCNFDFKAVFADKTETIRRRYNVCTESEWRIYDQ